MTACQGPIVNLEERPPTQCRDLDQLDAVGRKNQRAFAPHFLVRAESRRQSLPFLRRVAGQVDASVSQFVAALNPLTVVVHKLFLLADLDTTGAQPNRPGQEGLENLSWELWHTPIPHHHNGVASGFRSFGDSLRPRHSKEDGWDVSTMREAAAMITPGTRIKKSSLG